MKKILFALLALLPSICFAQSKKVLIVASNVTTVNQSPNGTFLMEIAYPFRYFMEQGYAVDVVSPAGGQVALYHKGDTAQDLSLIARDRGFIEKTSQSLSPRQVKAGDYAAIYYPGGYGLFWDVNQNETIARIAATIYKNGGVVGAAGHGAASLVDVRLSRKVYLVTGKKMTCFPTWAEQEWMKESEYGKLLPFDMQQALTDRKAELVVNTRETFKDADRKRVSDAANRLVTASFAPDAAWVAENMVMLMQQ
jgi:putative intracellular protease/amidase